MATDSADYREVCKRLDARLNAPYMPVWRYITKTEQRILASSGTCDLSVFRTQSNTFDVPNCS